MIYNYVCRQLAHMIPTAPGLCRRFAAFLICAASTQGSNSDDLAWHDVARWPCYNLKSRARRLAKGEPLKCGTQQAANASARAVLHHPHPARYEGAQSLYVARTRDSRREQLAARS